MASPQREEQQVEQLPHVRGVGFDGVRPQWAYDVRPSVLPPRKRESRYNAWGLAAGEDPENLAKLEICGTPRRVAR